MVRLINARHGLTKIIRNESGMFSIVELLYVVLILGLVLGALYNLLYFGEKNWAKTSQDTEARQNVRFASDKMVREIREAQSTSDSEYGVYSADKLGLQFYADINSNAGPERIHYYINNDRLEKGVVDPSTSEEPWEYNGTEVTEDIAKYIRNTDSSPVFKYYDSNGNELTNLPLNLIDRKKIRRVKITLLVDRKTNELPEQFEIESEIQLRNLRD